MSITFDRNSDNNIILIYTNSSDSKRLAREARPSRKVGPLRGASEKGGSEQTPYSVLLLEIPDVSIESLGESENSRWSLEVSETLICCSVSKSKVRNLEYESKVLSTKMALQGALLSEASQ